MTLAKAPIMGVLGMSRLIVSSAMPEASTQATLPPTIPRALRIISGGSQLLMMTVPPSTIPSMTSTTSKRLSSRMMTMSGFSMLQWISMGSALMRVNALIGAPIRSGPYSGIACMYRSCSSAVSATSFAAVTAPWPARACQRISVSCILLPSLDHIQAVILWNWDRKTGHSAACRTTGLTRIRARLR